MSGEIERAMRQGLTAARWILAPMYLGLGLMLIVLLVQFVRDFFRALPLAFSGDALAVGGIALSLALALLVAAIVLSILQTGHRLFAAAAEAPVEVDFTVLKRRLLTAAMTLTILLLLEALLAARPGAGAADAAPAAPPWPLYTALGVLVGARLVLEVAEWFARLSRAGASAAPQEK